MVRHCIKDMKLWGGRKLSKEKYVKVLRIDACIIARYSLKSLNQRKLFTPSVRKAAGLLGDDHSLLLDTLPFKKFIHLCIMQTTKKLCMKATYSSCERRKTNIQAPAEVRPACGCWGNNMGIITYGCN